MTAEEAVRELAKRLRARHPGFDPLELERDPDFANAVELLADEPAELLESLSRVRRKSPHLVAIALAAITARGVPASEVRQAHGTRQLVRDVTDDPAAADLLVPLVLLEFS